MLYELRNYIKKYNSVSIAQISRAFMVDIHAMKPMIDIWVNKGVVKMHNHPLNCKSSCGGCAKESSNTYYCWID
jgi:hypothetical protein